MRTHEPIAIIGAACRFPGEVASLEEYWTLLERGTDAVSHLPQDRFSPERFFSLSQGIDGHAYVNAAGIIDNIHCFDAEFFGISRKEAQSIDPQQRMAMETVWEALETAFIVPSSLKGSRTGVYMGASNTDMAIRCMDDLASMSAYAMTGTSLSIVANRISYVFDLRGPSMTVDTACSSSLVAVHQACEALRAGRISLAIAGGVNALLAPYPFIGFSQAHMLSPDGRCKAFDASGNGYVRSEGAGVIILKPLTRALKDNDDILALIAGSGVNSDGRTTGISLPNAKAQAALLREVYRAFGLNKTNLTYVEAHGTGTAAGDPLEAAAIGTILGKALRRVRPLPMGSVKSNIGHLESAAGIAGLLKGMLVLRRGKIPPNLHFTTPNPAIDFAGFNLVVPTRVEALPDLKNNELVSVNSFGFGGTNAHVVLQKAPPQASSAACPPRGRDGAAGEQSPLFLSANSLSSLGLLAGKYAAAVEHARPADCDEIASSLVSCREQMRWRELVTGATPAELHRRLKKLEKSIASGERQIQAVAGAMKEEGGVFVFTGNGSQWQGMGTELMRGSKEFRSALEEVDALLAPLQGWSLLDIFATPARYAEAFDYTEKSQPLLFALQVGLVQALKAKGILPAATLGHSVGEVAAAWACGALSLEDAATVIHHRSFLQKNLRDKGGMAVVSLPEARLAELLRPFGDSVQIAAVNTEDSFTLAGDGKSLQIIVQQCKQQRLPAKVLPLSYPFHSSAMDAIRQKLLDALSGIRPRKGKIPFFSTAVPAAERNPLPDNAYWWHNIRRPVLFHKAVTKALAQGFSLFMEIGPRPLFSSYLRDIAKKNNSHMIFIPTLTNNGDEKADFASAWKNAWQAGWNVNAQALFPLEFRKRELPSYPWNRERLWPDQTPECREFLSAAKKHPLLGWRLPGKAPVFENILALPDHPWLRDHKTGASTPYPAAAYIESMLAAGREIHARERQELERVVLARPLHLFEDKAKVIRISVDREDGGLLMEARGHMGTESFGAYARGRLLPLAETPPEAPLDLAFPERFGVPVSKNVLYETARSFLLNYGPAFQTVERAWVNADPSHPEVLAQLADPFAQSDTDMIIAPTLLDGAFQTLFLLLSGRSRTTSIHTYLPAAFDRIILYAQGAAHYVHARLERVSPRSVLASFRLADARGNILLSLRNCRFRRAAWLEYEQNANAPYAVRLEAAPHAVCRDSLDYSFPQRIEAALEFFLKDNPLALSENTRQSVHPYILLQLTSLAAAHESALSLQKDGQAFSVQALINAGLLAPEQEYWLCRMLERLENAGLASRINEYWQVHANTGRLSTQALWRTLISSSPSSATEALLLAHVFSRHKDLYSSRPQNAESGDPPARLMDAYFSNAASLSPFGAALAQCVPLALRERRAGQRLNILQVARNSSSLLSQVLPHIQALGDSAACRYVAAEKSAEAAEAAALLFDNLPWIEFTTLDLEEPTPTHQGAYHLILISYSLYEYENIASALKGCLGMLAPGGVLCLLEHSADAFTDYVFGAAPWWWKASRERTLPVSLLQPREFWEEQMLAAGFADVSHMGAQYDDRCPGRFILGRKNPESAETALPARNADARGDGPASEHDAIPFTNTHETAPFARPFSRWLLLAGTTPQNARLAGKLRSHLQNNGAVASLTPCGEDRLSAAAMHETLDSWISSAQSLRAGEEGSGESPLHVVYMCGYSTADTLSVKEFAHIRDSGILGLASLMQAWDKLRPPARLWILTGGALSDDALTGAPTPSQGALAGFARVLMNEMRHVPVTLLDLHGPDPDPAAAVRELLQTAVEPEVVLADGQRYVPRLTKIDLSRDASHAGTAEKDRKPDAGAALHFDMPGRLQNLYWRKTPPPAVKTQEIRIRVKYAGLNFRDVMWGMGMLQDEALENGFSGPTMGLECSGVIDAVGEDAGGWAVGDEVVGFAPACFSTHVVTSASAIMRKPDSIGFAEAATIPVCFFTAWYSLKHLAKLQPGERVLIHGAAGGVGLAAVQIAAHLGLEIYATAGAPEKHHFLHRLGVRHIFSSRSLAFADEIKKLTKGQGIDCVLNSLSGEAISAGISLLRPFGRFIELGKRDFYADTPMRLLPFSNNLSYFGVDVDQMLVHQDALARALFAELMELFRQRKLLPLPHSAYPAARVLEAFQAMQQSAHVGKLVVSLEGAVDIAREQPGQPKKLRLPKDASYAVTGGAGGFGLATALRLAESGAKHLLLISRGGIKTREARLAVERLRKDGVRVITARADVTNARSLKDCLKEHLASLPPLRGVVHAAAELEDKTITGLTPENIHKATAAKALGAWNLHAATLGLPLDFFVLYSSATTAFGNPGQAGYVAANCMLESLAHWRRKRNLPATAIGWGPINDTGMLTRNAKARTALLHTLGVSPTDTRDALRWLEYCLTEAVGSSHFFGLDWSKQGDLPALAAPRLSYCKPKQSASRDCETPPQEYIRQAPPEKALALITSMLIEESSSVLRIPRDRLSADTPLALQGMDSLMVVELSLAVEQRFGLIGYALPFSEKTTAAGLAVSLYAALTEDDRAEDWGEQALASLEEKHGMRIDGELRNTLLQTVGGTIYERR
ncbi:MAG: SDR family NAD(P)-dependent oxidoreductase [Desulfovibrio sp.]|jgi:acyl transferase domain-containing protein/NADPH:quinone reductase-like Zn-dependent oxidoreductase/NADP-dependent 3-hydroxy acid dehydrogenase YdfG|nr:SDR family NAD(P)-dependent oxidoreductase [Desulfovibrio sp.]